jgi:hypothetical protein
MTIRTAGIAIAIGILAGCANVTPEQLQAVDSKATSAMAEARKASSAAAAADAKAQTATDMAANAQTAADAAMSCCNDNKDRIERMFEQMMKK